MQEFEWDKAKAESNLHKHGVSFPAAVRIFEDGLRLEWEDVREDYGEERYVTLGKVNGVILYVVYTVRDDKIRIISESRATALEKAEYHGHDSIS